MIAERPILVAGCVTILPVEPFMVTLLAMQEGYNIEHFIVAGVSCVVF